MAASLASCRKRGDLTPPAVVASRDEPAVLRTRSQRLPGLSTAESDPFEPLDSTIQESAESAFVSRHCVAGSSHARADQRSPAKSCSLFEGVTTHDSRRHKCGKPDRDPVRITTWLAGQGRRSPPPSRGGNSANVFHPAGLDRTYGKLVSKSGKDVFLASALWLLGEPAHVAR